MKMKLFMSCMLISSMHLHGSAACPSATYVIALNGQPISALQAAKIDAPKDVPLSKETIAIDNTIAQTVAGAIIAAENTALGPLSNIPLVKDVEKIESAAIATEVAKGEEMVEIALKNEVTKIANSNYVKKEKSLFWSWCFSDDATKD